MSYIDIKIPHSISPDEALKRIKELAAKLQEEYSGKIKSVEEKWQGKEGRVSFLLKGFPLSAKIYVGVDTVRITGWVPFLLTFYKTTISRTIEQKGNELLNNYDSVGYNEKN